jgi:hypothetical protein
MISQPTREQIWLIARTTPADWGIAGHSTWSLATLAEDLAARKVVASISREHLRRILCCRPARSPARLRATYNRTGGVRHIIAALDLATGKIFYRICTCKRWTEFLPKIGFAIDSPIRTWTNYPAKAARQATSPFRPATSRRSCSSP